MQSVLNFVKNTKIYKRVIHSNMLSPGLYSTQHPLQFFLQQVQQGRFNRFDTIVRLLAIEAHFNENDYGWTLYEKMQTLRNQDNPNQPDAKTFRSRFEAVIESIKQEGYNHKYPVYCNKNNQLMDGSHRLACAIYFKEKTIKVKIAEQTVVDYSWAWFEKHFTPEELDYIQNGYQNVIKTTDIKEILQQIFQQKDQNFGRGNFYQSYDEIDIPGQRPTEKRFETYQLKKYLKPTDAVLDIGCNCGFFANYTADFVAKVDGIEINPTLCEIGSVVRTYLGRFHCNFYCSDFNNYEPKGKYDMIYSFAVHHWIGMDIKAYFNKLKLLLNPGGKIMFESQNLETVDKNFEDKVATIEASDFRILNRGSLKDDGVIHRKFVLFEWDTTSS